MGKYYINHIFFIQLRRFCLNFLKNAGERLVIFLYRLPPHTLGSFFYKRVGKGQLFFVFRISG